MDSKTLIFAVCFCLNVWSCHSSIVVPASIEDYHWRDFNGLIPSDAIPGGTDNNGVNTYLAQFTIRSQYGNADLHTLPATIKPGNAVAYAPYLQKTIFSNSTNNLKVLCYGGYASRYKWYAPTAVFPPNCRFVIGGFEDSIPMYIGRAKVDREVITGKIFSETSRHYPGLIIPYNGGEATPGTYEILTYCY